MEPAEKPHMNLGELIKELTDAQVAFTARNDLMPGIKNDMLKLFADMLAQAERIRPFYERIEDVRKEIIEPTNESIKRVFGEYSRTNERLGRRNTILSIISVLFGLLGIVLTALPAIR